MSSQATFDEVTAGLIFDLNAGDAIPAADLDPNGDYPVYGSNGIRGYTSKCNQFEDIILIGRQGSVGTVHLAKAPCWVAEHALRVYPKRKLNKNWLAYALDAQNLEELSVGTAQPGISAAAVLRQKFPLPPPGMQNRIAEYLDRETAQIDETITRIDRVVELLEERRWSSLDGVHRHLMKNYPTPKLDLIADEIVDGPFGSSLTSSHYSDSGARVIRLGNIGVNEFKDEDRAYIPLEYAASLSSHNALPGDIIVAGLGDSNNPVGRAAVLPEGIGPAIVKADCYRVRLPDGVDSRFIAHMINAPDTRAAAREEARGSTRIRLNTTIAKSMRIPLPDLKQQQAISYNLTVNAQHSYAMYKKSEKIKLLLQERRSALITAAVTGKVEV